MKQTLEIKIEVPEGYKAVFNEAEECIECVKIELPKTWEEFCENHPISSDEHFIRENSTITEASYIARKQIVFRGKNDDKNILPNKEIAKSFLALMQLIQLRDCYRQGWVPDWKDGDAKKYCISTFKSEIDKDVYYCGNNILSFQTEEIRDKFMENFIDLIEQAKDLI